MKAPAPAIWLVGKHQFPSEELALLHLKAYPRKGVKPAPYYDQETVLELLDEIRRLKGSSKPKGGMS